MSQSTHPTGWVLWEELLEGEGELAFSEYWLLSVYEMQFWNWLGKNIILAVIFKELYKSYYILLLPYVLYCIHF